MMQNFLIGLGYRLKTGFETFMGNETNLVFRIVIWNIVWLCISVMGC